MPKVISLPQHNAILVPATMCLGANFTGMKFKQVEYKLDHYVMVEHSDNALRQLAICGIEAPSGILRDYHWPTKYPSIFHHQRVTADFMVRNLRSFCFNGIGSAKSLTSLWASDYMMSRGEMGKVLICSTLSTLHRVWEKEIFTHLMHRSSTILHGSVARRRKRLAESVDYYIVNHEGMELLMPELLARKDITHVIMDEGARLRNKKTGLWAAAEKLCGPESGRTVWWMTGSPMPKAPTDAWAQARIVNPGTVPAYFSRFRDQTMYRITNFKWVPRRGWEDIVYATLRPAIRFKREDCIDLPPVMEVPHPVAMSKAQAKAYKELEDSYVTEFESGIITAANEGVKLGKLLQVACLTGDTEVLTNNGWRHLIDLLPDDLLWDGCKWVTYDGLTDNGYMDTINVWGVQMTLDHKLLTTQGWREAWEIKNGEPSNRFDRADFQLPDSFKPIRIEKQQGSVELQMCLRHSSDKAEPKPSEQTSRPQKLWVQAWRRYKDTWTHLYTPVVLSMDKDKKPLRLSARQRLQKLWCSRYKALQQVVRLQIICEGLSGHIPTWLAARSQGQQQRIHTQQLPVGNSTGAREQYSRKCIYPDSERRDDCSSSSPRVLYTARDNLSPTECRMGGGWQERTAKNRVYDVVNAGDQSRFLIRNKCGGMFLSHNCGAVYDSEGETHYIDVAPKLKELDSIWEEVGDKLIIFMPYKHTITLLSEWFIKKHPTVSFGVIDGSVSMGQRNKVFTAFQDGGLNIIIAHPAAMAHGLTLTAANTILWWCPVDDFEIYEQANGRISRPGQERHQYIKQLSCTKAELAVYKRLKNKESMQGTLLDMIKK